jgi:hypothetical protein
MGALDEVTNLRSQGVSDNEIIASLRGKGISPKEISDALSQAQIKNAVGSAEPGMESSIMDSAGGTPGVTQAPTSPSADYSGGVSEQGYDTTGQGAGYEQGYGATGQGGEYDNMGYDTVGQGLVEPMGMEAPQMEAPQMAQAGADYGGADYGGDGYYQDDYGGQGGGTDTIIEVAEQVFIEKSKKMKKNISENSEFTALASSQIVSISDRLKRIEDSMDKLQYAILEKVGKYGDGLESIKKEMNMMQDSFKKVVPKRKK